MPCNRSVTNADGSQYTGKGVKVKSDGTIKLRGFLKHTVSDLNKISSGGAAGKGLVSFYNDSPNNVTISSSSGSGNSTSGKNVNFDVNSTNGGLDVNGKTARPTFIGLAHEMIHAMENTRWL